MKVKTDNVEYIQRFEDDYTCNCLNNHGLEWGNITPFFQETLKKYADNEEMCNLLIENWREYNPNEVVAFNSFHKTNMVLSNMFPFVCEYDGKIFNSVDHLFHYLLAVECGNQSIVDEIANCRGVRSAFDSKTIWEKYWRKEGDGIREKSKNDVLKRLNILRFCWRLKFRNCEEFRKKIIESQGKMLMECAIWSGKAGAAWNRDKRVYEGCNLVGRYMTDFRDKILCA